MNKDSCSDLNDYIHRPINILKDAQALRHHRLSPAYSGEGGGNWSIVILCFISLETLAKIHWLLDHNSLSLKDSKRVDERFLSPDEQSKNVKIMSLSPDEQSKKKYTDLEVGAAARFASLVVAARRAKPYTFPWRIKDLREIWETFRNIPVHNAGFKSGTGGVVFYRDQYTPDKIDHILNHPELMSKQPPLENGVPWRSFYKPNGDWHCFGDILAKEVERMAEWLKTYAAKKRAESVKRVVDYIDEKILSPKS